MRDLATRALLLPAALVGVLTLANACQFQSYVPRDPPPDPDGQRRFAGELFFDRPAEDELHCRVGDCRDWRGIRVLEPGILTFDVAVLEREEPSGVRLILHGPETALDQTDWAEPPPLRVSGAVTPGVYFALVEGSGERVRFSLTASFAPLGGATEASEPVATEP